MAKSDSWLLNLFWSLSKSSLLLLNISSGTIPSLEKVFLVYLFTLRRKRFSIQFEARTPRAQPNNNQNKRLRISFAPLTQLPRCYFPSNQSFSLVPAAQIHAVKAHNKYLTQPLLVYIFAQPILSGYCAGTHSLLHVRCLMPHCNVRLSNVVEHGPLLAKKHPAWRKSGQALPRLDLGAVAK